jgi:hypothetical protein
LPTDVYAFIELYCDEPDCDCRRVTLADLPSASIVSSRTSISASTPPMSMMALGAGGLDAVIPAHAAQVLDQARDWPRH